MEIEKIYKILDENKLSPRYINKDDVGFSRWIEFETKYQKYWIEWYVNVSTLRVGDKYTIRIPFTHISLNLHSPSNKKCLEFSHKDITKNFGLADVDIDLTIEKLDWQEETKKSE